jgi:prepilin-type N-terminal cleavage/methylation domain-containing protein/prepilin-type processing-associated H-X9-DG protein
MKKKYFQKYFSPIHFQEITMRQQQKSRVRGFTLIELLVVVAIISLLAAILFPVFARAREQARKAACMSNLKQIGLAINMYVQDYDETYPVGYMNYLAVNPDWYGNPNVDSVMWYTVLQPYVKNRQVFVCPSAGVIPSTTLINNVQYSGGYGWNCSGTSATYGNGFGYSLTSIPPHSGHFLKLADVQEPANTVIVGDPSSNGYWANGLLLYPNTGNGISYIPTLHGGQVGPFTSTSPAPAVTSGGGGNYLFADGHVKFITQSRAYGSAMFNVDKTYTGGVLQKYP